MALLPSLCFTSTSAAFLTTENPSSRTHSLQISRGNCYSLSFPQSTNWCPIQSKPADKSLAVRNKNRSDSKFVFNCAVSATQEQAVDPSLSDVSAESQSVEKETVEFSRDRLIAQNIPWSSTAEDIRSLFEKHGTVLDVELSMFKKTRNRGLAFVKMGSPEEAQVALNNLDSSEFEGRILKVEYAKLRKEEPRPSVLPNTVTYCLFVSNLPFQARAKNLNEFFSSEYKGVVSASIIFQGTPRKSCGYGFVSFNSREEAEHALAEFQGKEFMGRAIRLARGRPFVRQPVEAQPEDKSSSSESNDSEVDSA